MSNLQLLTSRELAQHFGVSVSTIQTWVRKGLVPCIRPSRKTVRFRLAEVENAFLGADYGQCVTAEGASVGA